MLRPELDEVQQPLVDHLIAMGWIHLPKAEPGPYVAGTNGSGRETYADAVLINRFHAAVRRINPGPDGGPWLDEDRLNVIANKVLREPGVGVPGNVAFTELLTNAELVVKGLPGWDEGARQPIRLIDWEHPECNDLLVVTQFRVDAPDGPRAYAEPDLVLFVNGLPLVVIECKYPGPTALDEAIEQVLGYAAPTRSTAIPDLARFAQILVATDRESAKYGTITADPEHFTPWRLIGPATEPEIRAEVGIPGGQVLSAQQILAAGMLRPTRLLELLRDFTVSIGGVGQTRKIVARWQQVRAVRRMVNQLLERQNRLTSQTTPEHRGGVTWHTQGSGKSLTMSFLVRVIRSHPLLRGFKVVVVTDRLDLEDQIVASLGSTGQTPRRATSVENAHNHLARETPDLVVVTIQKSQRDDDLDDGTEEELGETLADTTVHTRVANESTEIVVLVDEAHRSQESWLHARLRKKVPKAVLIGFTGTPILYGRRKTTEEIFGPILDVYALKDAEADRAVVPLRYESWEVPAEIIDRAILDAGFVAAVPEAPAARAEVLDRFARRREVLEAEDLIRAKAQHMFEHWVASVLPDRFSAQVVAVSRRAAVRYKDALLDARGRFIAELQDLPVSDRYDPSAWADADERTRFLLTVLPHQGLLETMTVVPIISRGTTHEDTDWLDWTDRAKQRERIARFKQGLGSADRIDPDPGWSEQEGLPPRHPVYMPGGDPWDEPPAPDQPVESGATVGNADDGTAPIAFIVVAGMLLTGFDAPTEQVLYIDRPMRSVELLQAIARPNRPKRHKKFGLIVDYVAVAADLAQALEDYDPKHLTEVIGDANPNSIMPSLDEVAVPWLRHGYQDVVDLLGRHGVHALNTPAQQEELLALLDDPELRAAFDELTREFLSALNAVLPRPEALDFERRARELGTVQYLARRRYRDAHVEYSPYQYGAKVRRLIDAHLRVTGVIQRIPPVEITADDFAEKVDALPDYRARALEMKHALREHISSRMAADPVTYQRLSERLEQILRQMEEDQDFGQMYLELAGLRADVLTEEQAATENGLDRWTEQPVHSLLEQILGKRPATSLPNVDVVFMARKMAREIGVAVRPTHFLYNGEVRERVRRQLVVELVEEVGVGQGEASFTADRMIDLATRNRERFLRLALTPDR